jgi:hypothetical protein
MWSLVAVAATVLLTMMMSHLYSQHLPGGVNALAIVVSTFSTQRPTARNSYYYHHHRGVPTVSSNHHQYLPRPQPQQRQRQFSTTWLFQTNTDNDDDDDNNNNNEKNDITMPAAAMDRTSFDEAGRSLLDEQDMKRMNEMGDFDVNPNVRLIFSRFLLVQYAFCI